MNILVIGGAGYIGSALVPHLRDWGGHEVHVLDQDWFGDLMERGEDFTQLNPMAFLAFDAVIFLAGLSSVKMSVAAGAGRTFEHNVRRFVQLMEKLPKTIPFIYASSASVYGNNKTGTPSVETDALDTALNVYDMSKQMIDLYAAQSGKNFYGLRFGTVNGFSTNPRADMIIPMMIRSAKFEGVVRITNGENYRALLSMRDLCFGISSLLRNPKEPGFYNLSSLCKTIGDIGEAVAKKYDARIEVLPGTTTQYSFCVSSHKFRRLYDSPMSSLENIIQECDKIDWETVNSATRHRYLREAIPAWITD